MDAINSLSFLPSQAPECIETKESDTQLNNLLNKLGFTKYDPSTHGTVENLYSHERESTHLYVTKDNEIFCIKSLIYSLIEEQKLTLVRINTPEELDLFIEVEQLMFSTNLLIKTKERLIARKKLLLTMDIRDDDPRAHPDKARCWLQSYSELEKRAKMIEGPSTLSESVIDQLAKLPIRLTCSGVLNLDSMSAELNLFYGYLSWLAKNNINQFLALCYFDLERVYRANSSLFSEPLPYPGKDQLSSFMFFFEVARLGKICVNDEFIPTILIFFGNLHLVKVNDYEREKPYFEMNF
jgi:hypothetical protein